MDNLTKEFLAESQEGLERMERCLTELERLPDDAEIIAEIFRAVHTIKGTTGFLGFSRLETLAHAGENLLGDLRERKLAVTSSIITGLLDLMDGLRAILCLIETANTEGNRAGDDDSALIARLAELRTPGSPPSSIQLDSNSPLPSASGTFVENNEGRAVPAPLAPGPLIPLEPSLYDKTLRIDVDVLNRMMNLVGELVLTRNQILQSAPGADNFRDLTRRLDSVTADLRESVMQARMQPVGHLFGKFPRLVRDLARTCGRAVRIEFEGQETGLDKSLLEAIRDPLTHAVRNAVDHGIEPMEDRLRQGKPIEGTVRLRAFHQSGSVVIEVSDDGAGINVDRVLAKAIERGLITPEQAAHMSEREALHLIFLPGFSTAREVTSVSGRGVGMDVVRANVEKVGGSVELESHPGQGTTVRLRVPLTLAIVPALVVRSGGQSFALPQSALIELLYVPARDAATAVERIGSAELYRLREHLLPLVWFDRLLGLEPALDRNIHGFYIAVVESEGCRFGLVVDDLKAPEEIVVKPLSSVLREIGIFSGATVLGNGLLALILDVSAAGTRAGVRSIAAHATSVAADLELASASRELPHTAPESALVIYETWKWREVRKPVASNRRGDPEMELHLERMAMPLSAVERIETVPLSGIEYADGAPVLQYRGELLPVEDEGNLLHRPGSVALHGASLPPSTRDSDPMPASDSVTILICCRPVVFAPIPSETPASEASLAASLPLRRTAIVVHSVLDVAAGALLAGDDALGEGRLAMVKDKITAVHPQYAGRPLAAWQEVA